MNYERDAEQKLNSTVRLLKALVPEIDDALQYMEANGGWSPFNDDFLAAIQNLKLRNWAELYLDEKKLKTSSFLGFVGEEALEDVSDPQKLREVIKADFSEFLEEDEFSPPTEAELEKFKTDLESSDEVTQTAITKRTVLLILGFITTLYNYLALMVHGRTMCQLVADALGGD